MKKYRDIVYNAKDQMLDIYLPDSKSINAVFLYFHGGGIECGTKSDADWFGKYLTDRGIAVVSANYRLFPDAVFPDFLDDAADAVKWLLDNIKRFGGCKSIFVGGSSAGGYISMMLCFDNRYLEKRGIKAADIKGYIHDSGQPTCHYNVLKYSGIDQRRVIVDERSPLYFVGVQENLSPMLFLVADNDMENRYDQTMLMISTLKHFGYDRQKIQCQVMHGKHCEHSMACDSEGNSVFGKIIYKYICEFFEG